MKVRYSLFSWGLVALVSLGWASSCNIPIKNIEFCRDKGKFGAVCAYWLNARETKRNIPLNEWNSERLGMICTSEKGMGNIKATVERLCQNKQCVEKVGELIKAIELEGPKK